MAVVSQIPLDVSLPDEVVAERMRLIRVLIDGLPREARAQLVRELSVDTIDARGPTDVITRILRLVPNGQTVTAAELRKVVAERGVEAEPKEVYNAIGYLARSGRLKRTGYGRYTVYGVEIGTSDDLGGERDRLEDLSDGD
jgi:hypothetical protein